MNVLEKILEEIKALKRKQNSSNQDFLTGYISALSTVEGIICSHMTELPNCGECSRRKWYQVGYKDGKDETNNNAWIPVENELPEYGVDVLCMEKDTQKIYIGWCDDIRTFGISWLDNNDYFMDVEAWMPIPEPYEPKEPAKQSALSEREKFFTEGVPIYERTQTE